MIQNNVLANDSSRSISSEPTENLASLAFRQQCNDTAGNNDNAPGVNILGVAISPIDLDKAVVKLAEWRENGHRDYVCCVSVHGVVTAQRNAGIRKALNGAGLATKDGVPPVWWSRYAGFPDWGNQGNETRFRLDWSWYAQEGDFDGAICCEDQRSGASRRRRGI